MEAIEIEGKDLEAITDGAVLTRGLGRSYGDASLPPHGREPVARTVHATRVLDFDEISCELKVESGLSLGTLADLFLPRGFFVPVVPGTSEVTIGGMVAADVHGKNHHSAGSIGSYVQSLRIRLPNGNIETVTESSDRALFRGTLGGMGLTGHILEVTLRLEELQSRWIVEEAQNYSDLESLLHGLIAASEHSHFAVAWADLLARGATRGRGVLQCGRWAGAEEAAAARGGFSPRIHVPLMMPNWLLSEHSVGIYNSRRYEAARRRSQAGQQRALCTAESFFWPLDAIGKWNLLYGPRGMTQYQCVIPFDASGRSWQKLVDVACSGGPGPFLAVVKVCGHQGKGTMSFPMPGLSFALDFPVHAGTATLVARLNEVVTEAGGRIYLAKDAFTTAGQFAAMERRLPGFLELRERIDPDRRIDSALAQRLFP